MEVRTDVQLIISRAQDESSYNNSNTNRQSACRNNSDNQFEMSHTTNTFNGVRQVFQSQTVELSTVRDRSVQLHFPPFDFCSQQPSSSVNRP